MKRDRRAFLHLLVAGAVPAASRARSQDPPRRPWPAVVTQPAPVLTPLGERADGAVFQTENFEFVVEGGASPGLIQTFARCAEGTLRLWAALPLPAPPPPEPGTERALVRVLRNTDSYQAAGGPEGTAGRFRTAPSGGRPVLLVNGAEMGVDTFQGRTSLGAAYRPSLLVHELSHLATAGWMGRVPFWLSEGLAEYGALIPYREGVFRLDAESLRGALRRRADFLRGWGRTEERDASLARWITPLETLLDGPRAEALANSPLPAQAHRVYFTALLLTFYLMHLDPPAEPGGPRALETYLAGVTAEVAAWRKSPPRGRWRERGEGNREPEPAGKASPTALFGGRTAEEVEKAMRAALAAARISLS